MNEGLASYVLQDHGHKIRSRISQDTAELLLNPMGYSLNPGLHRGARKRLINKEAVRVQESCAGISKHGDYKCGELWVYIHDFTIYLTSPRDAWDD